MSISTSELFNFIQGSDITGASSYDIWKSLNPNGTEQEFLEFLSFSEEKQTEILNNAKQYTDEALAGFSGGASTMGELTVEDTNGILGATAATVNAQTFSDEITERIKALEAVADALAQI